MRLCDIADVDSDSEVTGFAIDHRNVARGSVFGAFKGALFNGEDFIGQAVDVADTLLKGLDHFRSLGPSYPIAIATLSVLLLIAMRTRSERFHGAFAIFSVLYLIAYPWLVFDTVA